MPSGLSVKVNNYGFLLTFNVINSDTSPKDLTGTNVTLYVYTQEQNPTVLFSGPVAIQNPPSSGICNYYVLSGNFTSIGTYNAELVISASNYSEETETFTIDVIPDHAFQPT